MLVGRPRRRRFLALSGVERIVFDGAPDGVPDEGARHRRTVASDG